MLNRRKIDRFKMSANVKIYNPGSEFSVIGEAKLRNLSFKGFSMITEDPVKRGGTYLFKLDSINNQLAFTGTITHIQHSSTLNVCGGVISLINFDSRRVLKKIIRSLSPAFDRKDKIIAISIGFGVALILKFLFGLSLPVCLIALAIIATLSYLFSPIN